MRRSFTGGASSSRSPPVFGSLKINTQVVQVNDSLYELHRPLIPPNVQIVLFHGLQKEEDYSEAHLSTWRSEDGSCVWPKTWLAEEIPGVHVFSVSYSGDMKIIGENLLSDLLHGDIGQKSHCPVILVGHSIGGLVIKQLCQQAHDKLHISQGSEKAKYEAFLSNLKLIFFYSTPHHGSQIAKKLAKMIPGPLFPYFEILSTDTARLNDEFEGVRKVRHHWLIAGVSEGLPTYLGPFGEHFVVREASARLGDFNVVDDADHFSICRPKNKSSRSFYKLKEFVDHIASDAEEEARALENWRPENFQFVPKSVTGLDIQVQEIKSKLDNDNSKTLGLVGMGGLGKTTLAKEVFNSLAPSFEYTCFIPNVKLIDGGEKELKKTIGENMHCHGKEAKNDQGWRTKRLLLVLDDTDGVRDENVLSEMDEITASEARIIFTTRKQSPLDFGDVYKVDFLEEESAKQLFLRYAFRDCQASATKFERLADAIITKCEGLPLALEVLGKFLGTTKDYKVWEQTLQAMDRAKDLPDINERLWGKLRASYDGLEDNLQQIFLDAATFFNNNDWTLGEAKIAWRAAYDCPESVLWKKLVDMSLVYDVGEHERIQLHEQLQSLGRNILSEPSNNRRREWDANEGLRLLQNVEELREKGIFALRVGEFHYSDFEDSECDLRTDCEEDDGSEDNEFEIEDNVKKIHIPYTAVDSLPDLRYLEVNVHIVLEGAQGLPVQPKLVVLDCKWPDSAEVLLPALGDNIALLKLRWKKPRLPTCIGSFSNLRSLRIYEAKHLKSLPDEFGNLSQLQKLVLESCPCLQTLPETFGSLSALNHLEFSYCNQLQALSETFGNLSALNHLEFSYCDQLQALPETIGNLSALNHLRFYECRQLQALPETFGNLSALNHLEFSYCDQLQALPETFGNLSALNHLAFSFCHQLQALPETFGNLSALNHLRFYECRQLQALPETFGNLSALNHLAFSFCHQLQALPETFGNLSALNHLEFSYCDQLQALPETFGNLSALNYLRFYECRQLQALPETFGNLSALNHLEFSYCDQLQALPETFGNLSALNHLEFYECRQLQALPETFGNLSALNHLEFSYCDQLQALPETFGNLSALNHLEFSYCDQLQALSETFGNLSALNYLRFYECRQLQALPETFGNLSALNHLEFSYCDQLQALPETFGNLSALNHLEFYECRQLQALPETFGNLSALNHLEFSYCDQLQALPETFGNLSALNHLEFSYCDQLQALSETFGNLSALNYLRFYECRQLQALPETFGNLSALNHLEFSYCDQLQALPETFGNLSALNHLEFSYCDQLQALSETFGNLSALNYLRFYECRQLQALPETFGNLSALNHLEFSYCDQLQALPETFGNLSALNHLEFSYCDQLQALPETFGNLSALNYLRFYECRQLQALSETFGNLSALNHLAFSFCHQLQALPETFGNLSALSYLEFYKCRNLLTLPESFRNLRTLNYLEFDDCDNLKSLPEFLRGALTIDPSNIIFHGSS